MKRTLCEFLLHKRCRFFDKIMILILIIITQNILTKKDG